MVGQVVGRVAGARAELGNIKQGWVPGGDSGWGGWFQTAYIVTSSFDWY